MDCRQNGAVFVSFQIPTMKDSLLKIAAHVEQLENDADEAKAAFRQVCERLMGAAPKMTHCIACDLSREDCLEFVQRFDKMLRLLGVAPEAVELPGQGGTWQDVRAKLLASHRFSSCVSLNFSGLLAALRKHLSEKGKRSGRAAATAAATATERDTAELHVDYSTSVA
jgi:hypothetical protein